MTPADNGEVAGADVDSAADPPDAVLIARSLVEPEAFAAIFDRHFAAVHRYLARRTFARRAVFRAEATTARPWPFGIATVNGSTL